MGLGASWVQHHLNHYIEASCIVGYGHMLQWYDRNDDNNDNDNGGDDGDDGDDRDDRDDGDDRDYGNDGNDFDFGQHHSDNWHGVQPCY